MSKNLKSATALAGLESAWERLAKVRESTAENTNERNRYTREAHIFATSAMAEGAISPEACVAGFHKSEGEKPYTNEQMVKDDGTYAKEVSQFRAINEAARRDLAKVLAFWPDGMTINDDKTVTYKPTLNRQQFVDLCVRFNKGDARTGEEMRTEIRDEAKAKSAAKRVLSNPAKATEQDLVDAILKLCGAAIAKPGFRARHECLALMAAIEPPKKAA